ncbi:phospholipase D-like domain-containing protein [Micropruina sp.]|uniref:phospholipase D-like domain-containing protein n=1 Tax=Micropruina sp. TaxID=2737536 RepID=UPI0039E495D0
MLSSRTFSADPLLRAIDADTDRISETRHSRDAAVVKVQRALLLWDGGCLPKSGADGVYGDETARAVVRYKIEVLSVSPPQAFRDVGPLTVRSLDKRQADYEATIDLNARRAVMETWLGVPIHGYSTDPADGTVIPHASGESALRALKAAIDACTGPEDLIVLSGWSFNKDTSLEAGTSVETSLRDASAQGVPIRALFAHAGTISVPLIGDVYLAGGSDNTWAVQFIRSLPTGIAIHDAWVLHADLAFGAQAQTGTHHQKIWAIAHDASLTTFVGGIDIDRTRSPHDQPAGVLPWHDVQLELLGDLATDAYRVLMDRWNSHPAKPAGSDLPFFLPPGTGGAQRGRTLATFGDPAAFAGLAGPPYPFASRGSKAVRTYLSYAISRAEHFIYLEDQYLVDASIGRELAARMPALDGLVIVIPPDNAINSEMHQAGRRRRDVLTPLAPFMDKVAVVWSAQFVHSKLWIFDDDLAVVGSANSNRRGYSHDSEADVAFGDLIVPGAVSALRTQLWTRALGPLAPTALSAPLSSVPIWKSATFAAGAHVEQYAPGIDPEPVPAWASPFVGPDEFWDRVIDPQVP